jgi:hypothetical protein
VETLAEVGFLGTLNVEREVEDQPTRIREIGEAVKLLHTLVARLRGRTS